MSPLSHARLVVAVLSVVLTTAVAVAAVGAQDGTDSRQEAARSADYTYEIRTVAEATDAVALSKARLVAAEERLQDLHAARVELDEARVGLDDDERLLLEDLARAKANVRLLAVEAYVLAGNLGRERFLYDSSDVADYAWRNTLMIDRAETTVEAAELYDRLREEASSALEELAASVDANVAEIAQVESDIEKLHAEIELAEIELVIAGAWERADAAIEQGRYGEAPPQAWDRLKMCESTNNYRAVSPTGAYRGAYQFDVRTWHTVGGSGDPIDAPPEEQDARARELYALRGSQPWPVCGRYLP